MEKLFGTDGIREIANAGLDYDLAIKVAFGIYEVLLKNVENPNIIIGRDTRLSGTMLESAMACAFASVGVNCDIVGVIPTPGLAFLTKNSKFSAGIMISASHNPFYYNGIKVFNHDGFKLSDEYEEQIEKVIYEINSQKYKIQLKSYEKIGKIVQNKNLIQDYIKHLLKNSDSQLVNLNLAIDCANGSSSVTAKKIFSKLGTNIKILCDKPDGININENCGSTNMDSLKNFVKINKNIDAGIAFDGDADRCIMLDENGEIVDGDDIVAICADYLQKSGKLKNKCVVGTVVSNIGFNEFYEKRGIKFEKSSVGDKNVLEKMISTGSCIGGEISGHVIFLERSTTGDGQLTAIQVLNIMKKTGKKLSELTKNITKVPQKSANVTIDKSKTSLEERKKILDKIVNNVKKNSENLNKIDILVRESGTENLVRIVTQGENIELIDKITSEIEKRIMNNLG